MGQTFVAGRSPERARELLDKAREAGYDLSVVRTTSRGYLVPEDLVEPEDDGDPEVLGEFGTESDPKDYTAEAVVDYLGNLDQDDPATEAEVARVLDAERAGKARKTILKESD